jgi:hypothetical protein
MKTALTVAVTFALALGTASLVAQTAGTARPPAPPAGVSPPPPAPAPNNVPAPGTMTPPGTPGVNGTVPPAGNQAMARPGSPTGMMAPNFNTLDRSGVGYITQSDAAGNPWLSQRFTTCDTDHNGQVSRAEYTACSTQP